MANGEVKYFSDLIGDAYKEWTDTRIILDGGTGTGKTYFILNKLSLYAQENKKTVLYLCNRKKLRMQVYEYVKKLGLKNTVNVITYQTLQKALKNDMALTEQYDYIISDECHYFTNDALFNEYTDVAYVCIKEQKDNVVVFISATAKVFFHCIISGGRVSKEHHFVIPKSYDYVDEFCFYDKNCLFTMIDEILEQETDSKIIVFCNSLERMLELYRKYGDTGVYVASKNAKKVRHICQNDFAIYQHEDGTITFDRRLLVTTKVLDNGVDLKDRRIKHIFSEILDADSAIQALGRKRPYDSDDRCTFYLKNYSGQAIQGLLNTNNYQIEPVELYRSNDYEEFKKKFGNDRKRIRTNKIFYTNFGKNKEDNDLRFNKMRLKKYLMDNEILEQMKARTYKTVMVELIGNEIQDKVRILDMGDDSRDEFLEYLKSIEGKRLYTKDRKTLVEWFATIGCKLRYTGINTINGALQDKYPTYKYRFTDEEKPRMGRKKLLVDKRRKLPDGSLNPNRDKKYWILE